MAYRKIEVNGKTFEYVIGKKNTKIKNVGIFINDKIGEEYPIYEQCSCVDYYRGKRLGSNCFSDDPNYIIGFKVAVTPKVIRDLIKRHA